MEKMERKTLKDFDGDYSAMCAYYGRFGGKKKQENYRIKHLIPAHKKIINLALNTELTQAEIAEKVGLSQSYISKFIKEVNICGMKKARLRNMRNAKDFSIAIFEELDVLIKKYLIDATFLHAVILDDQDEIEEDYKI